mmetsp:Transcript_43874/g.125511  ORF Transcript_43874/g.125511 Transcript_43874/m.125511 type:complete len:329 (+) Transcript_43874:269-1255(+)
MVLGVPARLAPMEAAVATRALHVSDHCVPCPALMSFVGAVRHITVHVEQHVWAVGRKGEEGVLLAHEAQQHWRGQEEPPLMRILGHDLRGQLVEARRGLCDWHAPLGLVVLVIRRDLPSQRRGHDLALGGEADAIAEHGSLDHPKLDHLVGLGERLPHSRYQREVYLTHRVCWRTVESGVDGHGATCRGTGHRAVVPRDDALVREPEHLNRQLVLRRVGDLAGSLWTFQPFQPERKQLLAPMLLRSRDAIVLFDLKLQLVDHAQLSDGDPRRAQLLVPLHQVLQRTVGQDEVHRPDHGRHRRSSLLHGGAVCVGSHGPGHRLVDPERD